MEPNDPFQYRSLPSLPPRSPDDTFQRERSGKPRPIGIAHPLKQASDPATEILDTSKLTLKSLVPIESNKLQRSIDLSSVTRDILYKDDSSDGSYEYTSSPPQKQLKPHRLPCNEGTHAEARDARTSRKWHVFITHSTSDQQWVRESLVVPLRDPPDLKRTAACYHFMPDQTRYNDSDIAVAMRDAYVIIVALSIKYIESPRCHKEWNMAVKMADERRCQLIVAAVSSCSRPEPLKRFLYLDFIDNAKRSVVWTKLIGTIDDAVARYNPQPHPPVSTSSEVSTASLPLSTSLALHDVVEDRDDEATPIDTPIDTDTFTDQFTCDDDDDDGSYSNDDSPFHHDGLTDAFEAEVLSQQQVTAGWKENDNAEEECLTEEWAEQGACLQEERAEQEWVEQDEQMEEEVHLQEKQEDWAEQGVCSQEEQEVSEEVPASDKKSRKRKREGENENLDMEEGEISDTSDSIENEQSKKVAKFYDGLAQPGADKRNESPIFNMRNFNNWVKSILLRTYIEHPHLVALDLCAGKGGDLNKWKEGRIEYLVLADISETSIEQCKERYGSSKILDRRTKEPAFKAEFIVADCCEVRLRDRYIEPARRFHITSCQFSIHYAFESYDKASMMLRNACENLHYGGYFIGTTVDSNELIRRVRRYGTQTEDGSWTISNSVYSVTFDPQFNPHDHKLPLPLFGCKYHFQLAGVVNVPEFLIHFPLFVSMLQEYEMEEILHQNLYDFFNEHRHIPRDCHLLHRMNAFDNRTGSMTPEEWETIGLYLVFVFRKKRHSQQ